MASRYLTCGIILAICFAGSLLLNVGAYFLFHEFELAIHMGISLIGFLVAAVYMLLIIPTNYIFGLAGSTSLMLILMTLVMAGTYALKSFDIQLAFPTALQIGIIAILVISAVILLGIFSFFASVFTYRKKHS